jgi:hypothetical protein
LHRYTYQQAYLFQWTIARIRGNFFLKDQIFPRQLIGLRFWNFQEGNKGFYPFPHRILLKKHGLIAI